MINSPKLPKNTNHKSITFFDQQGERFTINRGTLAQNVCAASVSVKSKGVVTLTHEWFKGDLEELQSLYANKRPMTRNRVLAYTKDRNSGLWVDDSPSVQIDWNGKPINGGHSIASALACNDNVIRMCVEIGVDPRMDTRIDTGKSRTPKIQGYYINSLRLAERLPDGKDVTNFAAAARLIWLYNCRYDSTWDPQYNPTESVHRICQTKQGQAFLAKLLSYFIEVKGVIEKANAKYFKNVRFYVPILMLCLAEQKDYMLWAAAIAKGTGLKTDRTLERCRDHLLQVCTNGVASAGHDGIVLPDIERALIFLYAKDIKSNPDMLASSIEWRKKAVDFFVMKTINSLRS